MPLQLYSLPAENSKFLDLATIKSARNSHTALPTLNPTKQQHNEMICRTCLQRATTLARRSVMPKTPIRRTLSATAAPRQAAAAAAPPPAGDAAAATTSDEAPARSSCVPGTVLNGLNYFKGKTDPVALRDDEYPEWLWACLDVQKKASSDVDADAGDEFCTSFSCSPSAFCRLSAFIPPPSSSSHRLKTNHYGSPPSL